MYFNQAAVFVKVVQEGDSSDAARLLGLPTSTVSNRVASLEKRLGITLLQRTTRRLHLTGPGALYFEHAAAGLGFLLDAEAAVSQSLGEPTGVLRVSAPPDLGDRILAGIIGRIRARQERPRKQVFLVKDARIWYNGGISIQRDDFDAGRLSQKLSRIQLRRCDVLHRKHA